MRCSLLSDDSVPTREIRLLLAHSCVSLIQKQHYSYLPPYILRKVELSWRFCTEPEQVVAIRCHFEEFHLRGEAIFERSLDWPCRILASLAGSRNRLRIGWFITWLMDRIKTRASSFSVIAVPPGWLQMPAMPKEAQKRSFVERRKATMLFTDFEIKQPPKLQPLLTGSSLLKVSWKFLEAAQFMGLLLKIREQRLFRGNFIVANQNQ